MNLIAVFQKAFPPMQLLDALKVPSMRSYFRCAWMWKVTTMSCSTDRLPATVGRPGFLTAVLTATSALGPFSEARAVCEVGEIAEFHVERVAGAPIIDGRINGQPIRILLETGSDRTYITMTAARQLQLPVREYQSQTDFGTGGNESVRTANVKELYLESLLLKDYTISVVGKEIHDGNGVASVQLGEDFLSHFTTEWDFSRGVVRLLQSRDCKLEQLVYWSPTYFQIDLQWLFGFDIKINGKLQHARLVSGSGISYISSGAAKEVGVEPGSPGVDSAEPFIDSAANAVPTWIGRFDTIELGAETIRNARLHIGDVFPHGSRELPGGHMTAHTKAPYQVKLGSDFLQAHRIMLVPDQHVALITYNGGPVF